MASTSRQSARLVPLKKEVSPGTSTTKNGEASLRKQLSPQSTEHLHRGEKQARLWSRPGKAEVEEEEDVSYLSDKPFFDVVLGNSHVNGSYMMFLPASINRVLPSATVPVVLVHGGRNWKLTYAGDSHRPRFVKGWKTFVTENHLKVGDACVFELMNPSCTNLKFKVIILRGDVPPELLAVLDARGKTPETAIVVD